MIGVPLRFAQTGSIVFQHIHLGQRQQKAEEWFTDRSYKVYFGTVGRLHCRFNIKVSAPSGIQYIRIDNCLGGIDLGCEYIRDTRMDLQGRAGGIRGIGSEGSLLRIIMCKAAAEIYLR